MFGPLSTESKVRKNVTAKDGNDVIQTTRPTRLLGIHHAGCVGKNIIHCGCCGVLLFLVGVDCRVMDRPVVVSRSILLSWNSRMSATLIRLRPFGGK